MTWARWIIAALGALGGAFFLYILGEMVWYGQGKGEVSAILHGPFLLIAWSLAVVCLLFGTMAAMGWARLKRRWFLLAGIPVACLLVALSVSQVRSHYISGQRADLAQQMEVVTAAHLDALAQANGDKAKIDAVFESYWLAVPQSNERLSIYPDVYPFIDVLTIYAIVIADLLGAPYHYDYEPEGFGIAACETFLDRFAQEFDPALHQTAFDQLCDQS